MHQAGIKRVVYTRAYKDDEGLLFLERAGVELVHLENLEEE